MTIESGEPEQFPLGDIYIALVDDNEIFDPAVHNRKDLDFTNVVLNWNDENSFWEADMTVRPPSSGFFRPGAKRRVFISEFNNQTNTAELLFSGKIESWPLGRATAMVDLKAIAVKKKEQREQDEDNALSSVDDDPWRLFTGRFDDNSRMPPEERLGARFASLHYPRFDSQSPVLTDLLNGDGLIDIGMKYIHDTLQFSDPEQAITRVEVVITAEFPSCSPVNFNASQAIGNNGQFSTLNPLTVLQSIPVQGTKVGDWNATLSNIVYNGIFGQTSITVPTEKTKTLNKETNGTTEEQPVKIINLPVYNYTANLFFAAIATGTRKEILKFNVDWAGSDLAGYEGRTEKIELNCQDLVGRFQPPAWQSGQTYSNFNIVAADGSFWICRNPHVSTVSIWHDVGNWNLFFYNPVDPATGPFTNRFFSAPQSFSWSITGLDGLITSIYVLTRNSSPGLTALAYAYNQARAKILSSVRTIGASFDVPWFYVRNITGRERIRISDPEAIPGEEMIGKVTSINVDLLNQRASISIASAPGKGTTNNIPQMPNYPVQPIGQPGIGFAGIINTAQQQINALNNQSNDLSASEILNQMPTAILLNLPQVPTGLTGETNINLGTFFVDTDTMINIEAP